MLLTLEQPVGVAPEWDEDLLSARFAAKPQSQRIEASMGKDAELKELVAVMIEEIKRQ